MKKPMYFILVPLFILPSCAWITKTTDRLVGKEPREPVKKNIVSQQQYDELLAKYETLKQKHEGGNSSEVVQNHNVTDKLLDDLNDLNPSKQVSKTPLETVDVFSDENKIETKANPSENYSKMADSAVAAAAVPTAAISVEETNREVGKYRQGALYMAQGKNDLALRIFQELERSPHIQVRVRAIYSIGDLLLKQGEYDLAMQVFENIVENYAFSGVILDSLKGLVACSEKLNLAAKKEKYKSMLTDIFGV